MLESLDRCLHAQVFVDFSRLSVLPQQSPQDPLSPHPLHLGRHASFGGTLPLTRASVSSFALRSKEVAGTGTGVNGSGFDNDTAILDKFLDMRTRVGVANFRLLSGVEPDFALADASDGRSKPLLRAQVDHCT